VLHAAVIKIVLIAIEDHFNILLTYKWITINAKIVLILLKAVNCVVEPIVVSSEPLI
jgi:hypothetical protein